MPACLSGYLFLLLTYCCLLQELGRRVTLLPSHMLFPTDVMKAQFAEDFDSFGDSYTDDVDETQLRTVFNQIDSSVYADSFKVLLNFLRCKALCLYI